MQGKSVTPTPPKFQGIKQPPPGTPPPAPDLSDMDHIHSVIKGDGLAAAFARLAGHR